MSPSAVRQTEMTRGFWPTATQELLLQAALLQGDSANRAFEAWQSCIDFDELDAASIRLLPLLYHNLMAHGIGNRSPLAGRLRGLYRKTWYKNQLLREAASRVLEKFSCAGVPTLVLKGVPLALRFYPTLGTRPMGDVDILVPEHCIEAVRDVVRSAGLRKGADGGTWPPRMLASTAFVHPDGWDFDLHRRVMHERLAADADDDFWASARPLAVGTATTLALAPPDLVLHVLAHGCRPHGIPLVRWIADVVLVLRREGILFEWCRLLEHARRRRLSHLVRSAMLYLNERFAIEIPAAVLTALTIEQIGVFERFEFRSRLVPGLTGRALTAASDYLRGREHESAWRGPLGVVRFARDALRLESSWQVPFAASHRAFRLVKRNLMA